jgi:hypothetical protein
LRRIVRREYFVVIVFPCIPRGMFRTPSSKSTQSLPAGQIKFSFAVRLHRRDAKSFSNRVREKSIFARFFRLIWVVQTSSEKYSAFSFS